MSRDPSAANRNAQAPEGHPEAHVSVDQTVKLVGVQPIKYDSNPPPITEANPPVQEPAGDVTTTDGQPIDASAVAAAQLDAINAQPEPPADPIPAGEVTPDATASEPAADHPQG